MVDDLKAVVQRMIDAGESEENIGTVIQHFKTQGAAVPPTAKGPQPGLMEGTLRGIPGVLSGLAKGVGKSVGGAAVGVGEMVRKIPGVSSAIDTGLDKAFGSVPGYRPPGGGPTASEQAFREAGTEMAPHGAAEQIGKFAGDVGMMAAVPGAGPGASLAKTALTSGAGSALMTGAQTGGNVPAMIASGGLGAAAPIVSKGVEGLAGNIRMGQAGKVATPRTTAAAKKVGETLNDPAWKKALVQNKREFADLIKTYKLTGAESDIAIIEKAPAHKQEVLSALSNQLGKDRPFSHLWSTLAAGSELGGLASGHAPEGLGIALPLIGLGVAGKYPGQTAKALSAAAPTAGTALKTIGGAAISQLSPMEHELLSRSFGHDPNQ